MDDNSGVPVVGQMLKAGDRAGLSDFLAFVKRGPNPDLALTDPALFQSRRAAATPGQLAGFAHYRVV